MLFFSRRALLLATLPIFAAALLSAAIATADPPDRVARVGFLSGSVSFRPATVDEWAAATLNYPMTTGDDLWTDASGRAELQLRSAAVRLGANTSLGILNLDNRVTQVRLSQGTLSVSVRDIDRPLGEVIEVDTPNGAVSLLQQGFYRIEVGPRGDQTVVTVRRGAANVATGTTVFDLGEFRSAVIGGSAAPGYSVRAAGDVDEWEDWCQWRDRRFAADASQVYVSHDVIGYEDLDAFGVWSADTSYGPVWTPQVSTDWAPYRFGHWTWAEPWGWTWIDDAPWGFAPFHYGRWVSTGGQWRWVPGNLLTRPVYAPALAAFVKAGASGNVSLGTDPIAWFPLAPGEAFVPAYRVSPAYLQAINAMPWSATGVDVTHTTYANRSVDGAMIAMARDAFVQGRPVAQAGVPIPEASARTASVVGTAPPVAPAITSIMGQGGRGVPAPSTVLDRPIVARLTPPPPPVSFSARQTVLAAHLGEPVDEDTLRSLQSGTSSGTPSRQPVQIVSVPGTRGMDLSGTQSGASVPAPARLPATTANPQAVALAAGQAADRVALETRHATEKAELEAKQQAELRQAPDARARQQLTRRQKQDTDELDKRQVREHVQMELQHNKERREEDRREAAAHKTQS